MSRCFPTIVSTHCREFDQTISKFKKHKAADAGGWMTETAQSCLAHPRLKTSLLEWTYGPAVSTNIPAQRVGRIHTHRLVCLDKGVGIRPMLMGMIWSKFLSHLLFKKSQVRLGSLSPRSTMWNRNPAGGPGHGLTSHFGRTPLACGCLS